MEKNRMNVKQLNDAVSEHHIGYRNNNTEELMNELFNHKENG